MHKADGSLLYCTSDSIIGTIPCGQFGIMILCTGIIVTGCDCVI